MQKQTSVAAPARTRTALTLPLLAAAVAVVCLLLTFLGYGQAVLMGIVQGLGEFLPISSSAHLILVPWFFGWDDAIFATPTFDIALHIGTLVAIVGFFWRDWLALVLAAPRPRSPKGRQFWLIVLATIPAVVAGLALREATNGMGIRQPLLIAGTISIMGLLLLAADLWGRTDKGVEDVGLREALLIGVAQACALIPGVSRSGATMSMGRAVGLDRESAARFSFLLSTPITTIVGLSALLDLGEVSPSDYDTFIVGVLISAIVGALSIGFLLRYIRQVGFAIFAAYRIVLAVVIVVVAFARG